jgi:flagellar biosynthesis chaperone FliJ
MPSGNTEQEKDWTVKHTLTEQEFRKLVLEKMERARQLQKANENRELDEVA